MRPVLLAFSLFASVLAFANSSSDIILQPGETTYVVSGNEQHKVTCSGANYPTIISRDCACEVKSDTKWYLALTTLSSNGEVRQDYLAKYNDSIQCGERLDALKDSLCKPM